MELAGKVAVVTGGASGIGRAMAARFKADGMSVVIADVEQAALDATAAELGVDGVRADVSDADSVAALADAVLARHGAVHVVCNNAGVGGIGPIRSQTLKDWRWVIDVNLWGVVHGIHSFLPHLLANDDGGHIVNTASMAGVTPWANLGPYIATKYAVVGISETLAIELGDTNVGVSVLCPGVVRTNIFNSQRNRPDALRNDAPNLDGRAVADTAPNLTAAMDPAVVADLVADAVRTRRFWIFTHPEMLTYLEERHTRMMESVRGE